MRLYCLARRNNAVCTMPKGHLDGEGGFDKFHLGLNTWMPFHVQAWQEQGWIITGESFAVVEQLLREVLERGNKEGMRPVREAVESDRNDRV